MESHFTGILPENGQTILICSLPSFGNIGQMALDCLLSSLASQNLLEHVGYATSKYLYPMCGYDQLIPQEKKRLCLPIEVYRILNTNYLLIQQRSPCFPSKYQQYSYDYIQFLTSFQAQHIFILCGSTTLGLSDEILQSNRFFHYGNPSLELFPQLLVELKQYQVAHIPWPQQRQSTPEELQEEVIDGSPIVSNVIQTLLSSQQLENYTILGRFCNEGNNLGDSIDLVVFIIKALQFFDVNKVRLTFPTSWNSLFGPPLEDNSMF